MGVYLQVDPIFEQVSLIFAVQTKPGGRWHAAPAAGAGPSAGLLAAAK
jgi:hypothetical protein